MVALLLTIAISGSQAKEIDSAYWSVEHKISAVGGGVNRQEDRLYLFKGGVAVRGFYQAGVDTLDLPNMKRDDRFGAWTKTGDRLTIRWGGGANPQSFRSEETGYVGDGMTWRPLKRVDGIKPNALFAQEDPKNDGCQLMLRSDGTFTFRNAHRINLIDLSKVAPDNGSGSYAIRNWTLYLKYRSGQVASLSLELPHAQDVDKAEFLYLATQNFYRWPGQLQGAAEPKREKIGDLSVLRSPGWIRSDDKKTGATTLSAPSLPQGVVCSVTFPPAQGFTGTAGEWHNTIWTPLTQGTKPVGGKTSEKVGPFLRSWTRLDRTKGDPLWISVYTLTSKGKGVVAMFACNRQDLFEPLLLEVEAMMATAKLP